MDMAGGRHCWRFATGFGLVGLAAERFGCDAVRYGRLLACICARLSCVENRRGMLVYTTQTLLYRLFSSAEPSLENISYRPWHRGAGE